MSKIVSHQPCTKCRERGDDRSGDNLKIYDDGHGFCFACGNWEAGSGKSTKRPRMKSKLTLAEVKSLSIGHQASRKVLNDIIEEHELRYESTGSDLTSLFYPYFVGKDIVAYKVRKILPEKDFFWVGTFPEGLWGKQLCNPSDKDWLIVTEGEEDMLALKSFFASRPVAVEQFDVVSLADGASFNDKLAEESDFFEKYKRVYLWLDSDTPGKKLTEDLSDFLAPITQVRKVSDPRYKDASEAWMDGAAISAILKSAEIHEPEGVVNGCDIPLEELLEPMEEGYAIPFLGLQEKLHGIRKAEITTVCAGSGIGKSTLVREISLSLNKQGLRVANVALEDQMKVSAQALMALEMDIPLATFRFKPPPQAEVQPIYDAVVANDRTFFYKHFGGLNKDSLINRLRYYARSKQCDFIILDHLSIVISGSESNNERKDIDSLMTELAKLVVETGVGIIQIVHLKRKGEGTSFAKGGEVELTDLRGSAALEQLSWNVIGLERDQQGEDQNFSRIRVLKNRLFGFTGLADTVRFDPKTGRMNSVVEAPPEITEDITTITSTIPSTTPPSTEDEINEILRAGL